MRHYLSEMLKVNSGERFKVCQNLGLLSRALHDTVPGGGIEFRAITVFMIDWTWSNKRNDQDKCQQVKGVTFRLYLSCLAAVFVQTITTSKNDAITKRNVNL